MQIVRNIEFQEKFFNDIYKSYFNKKDNQNEKEQRMVSSDIKDKILIYTDDFEKVLKDIFHMADSEKEMKKYNVFNEIIIKDKRIENIEVDQFNNSCLIEMTYAYRLKHYTICLVKKLNRRYMNLVCEVILLKPLDLFAKRALKDIPYKDFTGKDNGKLKDYLHNFKNYYDERKYIANSIQSKSQRIDDKVKEIFDDFDSVLGLEVINQIVSSPNNVSKSQYERYKKKIIKEFQDYAIAILESLMEQSEFIKNFQYIDSYFQNEKELKRNLNKIFDKEIIPDIAKSYENGIGGCELLINSLKLYAVKLDEVLKDTVLEFKNEVLEKVSA